MGSVILATVVSLIVGGLVGYLLGGRAAQEQARRQLGPSLRQAGADAIVDFLRLVNELRPREADAVRGLAWEEYPEDYGRYIKDRLRESPFRPGP
jgi:hypothetical protein